MPGLVVRHAAAVGALLLAAPLAGCSGDAAESAGPSPTPSESSSSPAPSVSPSSLASPEPRLPRIPPARDTAAGREAFAELVIDRWGYALRTNDAVALTGLSPKGAPCDGCAGLAAELGKRKKQGWYVDFPGADVVEIDVASGEPAGVHAATAEIDVPASQSYFDDGELRNVNEARNSAKFEVRMRLDKKRYSLLAFRVF